MDGLRAVIEALRLLSEEILALTSENRTLNEMYGWTYPVLTRHDLASVASNLADELETVKISKSDNTYDSLFEDIISRINRFKSGGTKAQLFNGGNSLQAIPVYLTMMEWIIYSMHPITGWQVAAENKYTPKSLTARVKALTSEIEHAIPNYEATKAKIEAIESAHENLLELPIGLDRISEITKEAEDLKKKYVEKFEKMETALEKANDILGFIQDRDAETSQIVSKCNQAYMATTSAGLAGAFAKRAGVLESSIRWWTAGLLLALGAGAYIGIARMKILTEALSKATPDMGAVTIHLVISALGVALPLWFAWLATKQIGQRFKLAEDYSFKATVAQAYEGYRQEAIRVDEALEARLFDSALTRLEELPLRLLDDENHGSPASEIANSKLMTNITQGVGSTIGKAKEKIVGKPEEDKPSDV